jgi:hypothetical protein
MVEGFAQGDGAIAATLGDGEQPGFRAGAGCV